MAAVPDVSRERRAATARSLHPAAWWVWAAAVAAAAMLTTNPFLLAALGAVAVYTVAARRPRDAAAVPLVLFLRLGLVVIVLRVVLQVLFGDRLAGHELFALPQVPLPSWAAGVSIGGPVTAESLLLAFDEGLQPAVVMAEAPHGTAPSLLGKNVANPMGMVLACAAALGHANDPSGRSAAMASAIREAMLGAAGDGVRTFDLGGGASTTEVVDEVIRRIGTTAGGSGEESSRGSRPNGRDAPGSLDNV